MGELEGCRKQKFALERLTQNLTCFKIQQRCSVLRDNRISLVDLGEPPGEAGGNWDSLWECKRWWQPNLGVCFASRTLVLASTILEFSFQSISDEGSPSHYAVSTRSRTHQPEQQATWAPSHTHSVLAPALEPPQSFKQPLWDLVPCTSRVVPVLGSPGCTASQGSGPVTSVQGRAQQPIRQGTGPIHRCARSQPGHNRGVRAIQMGGTLSRYSSGKQRGVICRMSPMTTILFSVSMNLTALCSFYKWNHAICVLLTGILFTCIMSSRFIHLLTCVRIFFLSKAGQYSIMCICHIFIFIHLLMNSYFIHLFIHLLTDS